MESNIQTRKERSDLGLTMSDKVYCDKCKQAFYSKTPDMPYGVYLCPGCYAEYKQNMIEGMKGDLG